MSADHTHRYPPVDLEDVLPMILAPINWLHIRYAYADLRDYRWLLAIGVIVFSALDLWITQSLLSLYDARSEGNPVMVHIIMTWFAWPIRVGVPLICVTRDLRRQRYELLLFAFTLYGTVIAWNSMFMLGVFQ